jgi:hypothetical protein
MKQEGTGSGRAVTTRTLRICLRDDGILQFAVLPGAEMNRADAKEGIASAWEVTGQTLRPLLADMRSMKSVDRGARTYFAALGPEVPACAAALLVGSPLSCMIAAFVMVLVPKPVVPTRTFTSEPEAVAWLLGFVR